MLVFFVIDSVLYLGCSKLDYQWGQTLLDLPEWLRTVNDDMVWVRLGWKRNMGMRVSWRMGPIGRPRGG